MQTSYCQLQSIFVENKFNVIFLRNQNNPTAVLLILIGMHTKNMISENG